MTNQTKHQTPTVGFLAKISCLITFLMVCTSIPCLSQPVVDWYNTYWAKKHHYDGLPGWPTEISRDESGEDWPYMIKPSFGLDGTQDGFIITGFTSYKNLPYRANICNTPVFPSSPLTQSAKDNFECDVDPLHPFGYRFNGEHKPSIFKLDMNGKMVWHKSYAGDEFGELWGIIQSKDKQYYYACGWTSSYGSSSVANKEMGYNNPNTNIEHEIHGNIMCQEYGRFPKNDRKSWWTKHFYVIKIDRNGNAIWEMTYGTERTLTNIEYEYEGRSYDLAETHDGSIIAVGYVEVDGIATPPIPPPTDDKELFRVLIDPSNGNALSRITGIHSGSILNSGTQWNRSIVDLDDGNHFALIQNCENTPGTTTVMAMVINADLTPKASATYQRNIMADAFGSLFLYATDGAKDPFSNEIAIGVAHKGNEEVQLYRCDFDLNGAEPFINVPKATPTNPVATQANTFDFMVGLTYLDDGEIAMISSTKEFVNDPAKLENNPPRPNPAVNICMNENITSARTTYWGADALFMVTNGNKTNIAHRLAVEHQDFANFGNDYPKNVSRMECLYSIAQGADGKLYAVGNDGANFDDYVVIKFGNVCKAFDAQTDIYALDIPLLPNPWNLSENTNITGTKQVFGEIIVNNGATLTISNANLMFDANSRIIVQRGGRLIVSNSTLTARCDKRWDGIWVYGDPTLAQSSSSASHGMVTVSNNSIIEKAINGIYAGNPNNSTNNGGIIRVYDSKFFNNRVGINFPVFPSNGLISDNISFINDTEFDSYLPIHPLTKEGKTYVRGSLHHIALVETHGISITGCSFKNTAHDGLYDDLHRSNGIQCINGTFILDRSYKTSTVGSNGCTYPSGAKNEFLNLHRGVNVYDFTPTIQNAPVQRENIVLYANFLNCQNAMVMNSGGSKKFHKNYVQFDDRISRDFAGKSVFGIQSFHTEGVPNGYTYIDSNSIRFMDDFVWSPTSVGMEIRNSTEIGAMSYIYRNVTENLANRKNLFRDAAATFGSLFNDDMKIGFISSKENPNLDLNCNTYINLNIDWKIDGTSFRDQGDINSNIGNNAFSINMLPPAPLNGSNILAPNVAFELTTTTNSFSIDDPDDYYNKSFPQTKTTSLECAATDECAIRYYFENNPGQSYDEAPSGGGEMMARESKKTSETEVDFTDSLINVMRLRDIPFCNSNEATIQTAMFWAYQMDNAKALALCQHCGWFRVDEQNNMAKTENLNPSHLNTNSIPLFKIYPNPANTTMQLEFDKALYGQPIIIADALGRIKLQQKLPMESNVLQLNISDWAVGFYFIKTSNSNAAYSHKFIVIR